MKRFVAIALLLFGSFSLFAQQWESIIEINSTRTYLYNGCCGADNTTVFVGINNFVGISDSEAFAIKVDEEGNCTTKAFAIENCGLQFRSIQALPNGNFFVTGNYVSPSNDYFWVLILDSNLDIVVEYFFEKEDEYSDFWFDESQSMLDSDGTIVVTTGVGVTDGLSVGTKIHYMYRFDTEGNCLKKVIITREDYNYLFYSATTIAHSMIGIPNSSDFMYIGSGQGNVASIIRFDYDFNVLSNHIMLEPKHGETLFGDYSSDYWYNDSTLLIVGTEQDENIYNEPFVMLGKVNLEGIIFETAEENKEDTLNYANYSNAMFTANDTTIFMVSYGMLYDWMGPVALEVFLCDKDLEILGKKQFYNELGFWPNAATVTRDNGLVVTSANSTTIRIKKFLREDFNPIPCSVKNVSKEQIKATVFPNPAGDEIHFDISELPAGKEHRISISDAMGRTIMSRIIRGEGNVLTLGVSSLPSGIYTYRIYNAENEIVSGKFVKE